MDAEFREKFITTLCAASLFSLTLLLFGPLYLYVTNVLEYPFLLSDVWYYFVIFSVLFIVIMIIFLIPLKLSLNQKIVSLIFAFAFLLWLQGNIFVWNYGVLDGKEISWKDYKINGFIDTSVWLFVLIIAFVKSSYIYKIIKKISTGLIIIQLVSLSVAWFQAPQQPNWKNYIINGDSAYSFSKNKNVIILVLDGFQTDIFQEIINEQPEYRDIFKGFTYFRNAVGGYPTTYASIPLILTGQYYDNSIPIQDFIKNAYLSTSIPYLLKQNSYDVDLFPNVKQTIYFDDDLMSNLDNAKETVNKENAIFNIYNVTLFRHMPHFTKKYFFDKLNEPVYNTSLTKDFVLQDLDFADGIVSKSVASNEKNMFKFFHLRGVHPPFKLNERLERVDLSYNRSGCKSQAKAALEITSRFLTALKKVGVYDKSMIFIVGDHGLGSFGVNEQASGYLESNEIGIVNTDIIAYAIPLILVKPFTSAGDIKVSDAPVSLSDIPKTIISELGLDYDYPGYSMFTVKKSDIRERRFLAYNWEHEYWNKEYLPAMQEYMITGFSWLKKSWRPTYRIFTPEGIKDSRPHTYQYGSEIKFGVGGNASSYQLDGWSSFPEEGFTWTDGKSASLVIPVNQPQSDLILKAVLTPFVSDKLERQRVNVYINGEKLGEWIVNAAGEYKISIPKKYISDSLLKIHFELPDACSPSELNISDDNRTLGIALQSIVITQPSFYEFGSKIQFGDGGNAEQYQGQGWSGPEKGFTWTDGKSASLVIPVNRPQSDLILKAVLTPFISSKVDKQKVNVYINGEKLGKWDIASAGEYEITIPESYITSSLKIDFELPDASSPSESNISNDTRILGIAVQSITLSENK